MKKLVLSAFLAMSAMTVSATVVPTTIVAVQDEYKEINVADVAPAVVEAVKAQGATIEKAYINDQKEYKLEIKTGDAASTVYYTADGKAIAK